MKNELKGHTPAVSVPPPPPTYDAPLPLSGSVAMPLPTKKATVRVAPPPPKPPPILSYLQQPSPAFMGLVRNPRAAWAAEALVAHLSANFRRPPVSNPYEAIRVVTDSFDTDGFAASKSVTVRISPPHRLGQPSFWKEREEENLLRLFQGSYYYEADIWR